MDKLFKQCILGNAAYLQYAFPALSKSLLQASIFDSQKVKPYYYSPIDKKEASQELTLLRCFLFINRNFTIYFSIFFPGVKSSA